MIPEKLFDVDFLMKFMDLQTIAKWDRRLLPLMMRFMKPEKVVRIFSQNRVKFHDALIKERRDEPLIPEGLERTLWGIRHRSPLGNAAGMYKDGRGYEFESNIGAGAFIGGTTTFRPQEGFTYAENGRAIKWPVTSLPRSRGSFNRLALPNPGDAVVSEQYRGMKCVWGCPIWHSVMVSPGVPEGEALEELVEGMRMYEGIVDVIELNVSCPNTEEGSKSMDAALEYVSEHFLKKRRIAEHHDRPIPVVVKFSNDTPLAQVQDVMQKLIELGYDGVNFGNTSKAYSAIDSEIHPAERRVYEFLKKHIQPAYGGKGLKIKSKVRCQRAVSYLNHHPPAQEFHVIRTGGIENALDIKESNEIGVSFNQEMTGHYARLRRDWLDLYATVYKELQS